MTFVRTTTGAWVNLATVDLIDRVTERGGVRCRGLVRGEDQEVVGYIHADAPAGVILDVMPAPPLWRLLRAGQGTEGMWLIVSDIPLLAFGMTLEGRWRPLGADWRDPLLDPANPTAIKHIHEHAVYDTHGDTFPTALAWLEDVERDANG